MNSVRPVYMEGETVALAQLDPRDAGWLTSYLNDQETTRFMATGREPAAVEEVMFQISHWQKPVAYPFAVLQKDGEGYAPIGYCGLFDLDLVSRKAEFRILLAADKCGQGHGTEATRLTVRFGFEHLNLHRIWLGVTTGNIRATGAYTKAGFVVEGTLEDDLYRNGQFYNSVRMAVLRRHYDEERVKWAMERVKPAGTSGSGPGTARPVDEPLIDSSRRAEG